MNSRERFYSALCLEEPDQVPITDLLVDVPIVNEITGEKVIPLSIYAMQRDLREREMLPIMERNMKIYAKCWRKLSFDAVVVSSHHIPMYEGKEVKWLDERTWVGWWGEKWRLPSDPYRRIMQLYAGGSFDTLEDLEEHIPPALDPEAITKAVKIVKREIGEEVFIIGMYSDVFSRAWKGVGLAKFLEGMHFNQQRFERILDKVLKHTIEALNIFVDAGVDAVLTADDYADAKGPIISPRTFRELITPRLKIFVSAFKKRGIPVLKHTDGNIMPIIDEFIDAGFVGLNPIEPQTMDIGEIKEKYGDKICVLGNIDCTYTLPYGTTDDVRREVRACIDKASPGGGHVLTSSNTIHSDCKIENVIAMVDEARRYGRYPK